MATEDESFVPDEDMENYANDFDHDYEAESDSFPVEEETEEDA